MAGFDFEELEVLDPSQLASTPESRARAPAVASDGAASRLSGEINVRVWTLSAETAAELRLPTYTTIAALKERLRQALGVHPSEQRLLAGAEILEDARCLRDVPAAAAPLQLTLVQVAGARRVALSGGRDCVLRLWDIDRGEALQELRGHVGAVTCAALAWRPRRALSGGEDAVALLWDLDVGRPIRRFHGHAGGVTCLVAEWASRRLLTGSRDATLLWWDIDSAEVLLKLEGHVKPVLCAAVDMRKELAVSGGEDLTLKIWDLENGDMLQDLLGHRAPIFCLSIDMTRDMAISGSFVILRFWNIHKGIFGWGGMIEDYRDLMAHKSAVMCAAVNWEEGLLLSGGGDAALRLWSVDLDRCSDFRRHTRDLEGRRVEMLGHELPVTCLAADWPSGLAVSGSEDCSLRVWDVRQGTLAAASGGGLA